MPQQKIIAIGLLTQRDLAALGSTFERLWPVEDSPCFPQLLQAIDEADRELWRARDDDASFKPAGMAPG